MENFNETNVHQLDLNKKLNEPPYEINKLSQENDRDINKSICNDNINSVNQINTSSISATMPVNPLKVVLSDNISSNNQQTHININENGKLNHRRSIVQQNLQPLLKKPINNISTTKPLILPAPISDSYSQGNKTNIVTMHSNYSTSSISSQFNNCQQQMAMGIATIQPQHFGYSGLSNNRYPMMPISLQNSYSTQQLTLANGGLGTAVQLMPVMNQNNNQMNNSRVQSLPLFMTPIIGAHNGMLFQPNMTIMPQSSNTMQTINIPNSSGYSNEYNPGITMQSQPMYSTGVRNTALFTTDFESMLKQDIEPHKSTVVPIPTIVEKADITTLNSKINKLQSDNEPALVVRSNVKHRELIRTQIYRMKQIEDCPIVKIPSSPELIVIAEVPIPIAKEAETVIVDNKIHIDTEKIIEIESKTTERYNEDPILIEEPKLVINTEELVVPKLITVLNESIEEPNIQKITPVDILTPHTPITTAMPMKRKLPSPEILDEIDHPRKLLKSYSVPEKSNSDPKSPGSLFEKFCKDNPERQTSMFNYNSRQSNKLTAVVRPEQRKILVHYLDDLIVFESDEPFPTNNKMQVVKSALKAGNIKLNSQKAKLFTDHFLYTNTDDEMSPNQQKQKFNKNHYNQLVVKPDSCMEPLSIDIPTTNTTSSCGSVDSSQVRPLSVCSRRSPTPVPIVIKNISKEIVSQKKDIAICTPNKEEKNKKSVIKEQKPLSPPPPQPLPEQEIVHSVLPNKISTNKDYIPVKQVSPVKQKPQKSGQDRPICEWSVSDVADFVKQTPGCDNYVSMFQNHEIDGEALLLLSNDNLIQGALNMKIGPALKLCARIEKRKALDPPQQ